MARLVISFPRNSSDYRAPRGYAAPWANGLMCEDKVCGAMFLSSSLSFLVDLIVRLGLW